MNLITGSILTSFSGAFGDLFDTFARSRTDRWIVVFKEPQKVITQTPTDTYAGYGGMADLNSFTLVPVSGVYPAQRVYEYKTDNADAFDKEINARLVDNQVRIKVEADAKNFITNGKTESILVDGQLYNQVSQYKVQDYLGIQYFYFNLKQVT